ncbi:SRPBCC family protein [soil metagenome]
MSPQPLRPLAAASALFAFTIAGVAAASSVHAATVSRSIEVQGSPDAVWAKIGPYCTIKDWHPAISACTQDRKTPPTRVLVTKDGATFVERQTGRSDAAHRYAYTFVSSPVPVTRYNSTFRVVAKAKGVSTVIWTGVYTPVPGKEKDAAAALAGIYESGLAEIKSKLAN